MLLVCLLAVLCTAEARRTCTDVPPSNRLDCGYSGITTEDCEERGCCYVKEAGAPSCFFDAAGVNVTDVHVIFSNHFDAGYKDLTVNVINLYFDTYFPRAASVGDDVRKEKIAPYLGWMTQAWLVSLYVDCPTGLGLHCPSKDAVETFKRAVQLGDITWHAYPHNAQQSLGTRELVVDLVHQTRALDTTLPSPFPPRRTLSQRDVVGLPAPLIPALRSINVTAISVGSNGRCLPPNVPPAFVWKDTGKHSSKSHPPSGEGIFVIWHQYGYGSIDNDHPARPYLQLPGHAEALAYYWRGDNEGPPLNAAEVGDHLKKASGLFPGSPRAFPSTLDAFINTVPESSITALPTVAGDLEDTWVQGGAQAPTLMQRSRALMRAHSQCARGGQCVLGDKIVSNFTRFLSKTVEHTFGISISHYGKYETVGYPNVEFHAELAKHNAVYDLFAQSWFENWQFGPDAAVAALRTAESTASSTALLALVEAELAALPSANAPILDGYTPVPAGHPVVLGGWASVTFNAEGAIEKLVVNGTDQGADTNNTLGLLRYQTLTDSDFLPFRDAYLFPGSGGSAEYGKPGVECCSRLVAPLVKDAWASADGRSVVLRAVFSDAKLHTDFGAPSEVWTTVSTTGQGELDFTYVLINKTSTRYAEAAYVTFDPKGDGEWFMDCMGESVSPLDVRNGASQGVHGITAGVSMNKGASTVTILAPDTALVRWGKPEPTPMPLKGGPDLTEGASFPLFANVFWNTNYPEWFPFDSPQANFAFRFSLVLSD